jgi:hypothetical protein
MSTSDYTWLRKQGLAKTAIHHVHPIPLSEKHSLETMVDVGDEITYDWDHVQYGDVQYWGDGI